MKTLIYTFLALFIWASIPVDAIASRRERNDHRSSTYSENNSHDRHEKRYKKRHEVKKHRKHYRKSQRRTPQHWRPATRVRYIPAPVYRSYVVPSGYVYTSTPGVSLYFSW